MSKQRPEDKKDWTEEDWYQNNIEGGMDEASARLAAAQEVESDDLEEGVKY